MKSLFLVFLFAFSTLTFANDVEKAIQKVADSCGYRSLSYSQKRKLAENTAKSTYLAGNGLKLQVFLFNSGRVLLADLDDCEFEHFKLRYDSVVETLVVSGQLYLRTENQKLYVLIPQAAGEYDINEVYTASGSPYKLGVKDIKRVNVDHTQSVALTLSNNRTYNIVVVFHFLCISR